MNAVMTCPCHGEPMYWHKDPEYTAGGSWDCAVKVRERRARFVADHAERIREQGAQYRGERREEARERSRLWREAHPEERREQYRRFRRMRRAREAGVETDGHKRADVFARDSGICQRCGVSLDPKNWHEDHIVPIVAGGPDTMDNVRATCPFCNMSKGPRLE